jgi:hypothetical protein
MNIQDIPAGESWGCRFKITTFLDESGKPVAARNLAIGQTHPGQPGVYEGIGVIQVRDIENRRVQLQDVATFEQYTVSFDDVWDVDTIEWVEDSENA